jgi:hypothetical protein
MFHGREFLTLRERMDAIEKAVLLSPQAHHRKPRLFACACARAVWNLLLDPTSQKAVTVAEKHADGWAKDEELIKAQTDAQRGVRNYVTTVARWVADPDVWQAFRITPTATIEAYLAAHDPSVINTICAHLLNCLEDVFGDPGNRNEVEPDWLEWHEGIVRGLAKRIYKERDFHLLPILADALEEAGCDQREIIHHCREHQDHVRGCWAIDLLLGKS